MNSYVLCFQEIDRTKFTVAGCKGANLGELSGITGIRVPEGYCVSTEAYKKITDSNQELNSLLDKLTRLKEEESPTIRKISATIRSDVQEAGSRTVCGAWIGGGVPVISSKTR